MSPRRSSRARGTQPPPTASTHTNSSNSSVSSSRQERSTRSSQKQASPRTSNPRSQSADDVDEPKPPPRRTRSGHEDLKEDLKYEKEEDNDEEVEEGEDNAAVEDEEVTRCVCGKSEYPGLPSPVQEHLKQQAKLPDPKYELEAINDDLGGLFVQCDICKVWQHGGCVGILDETADDYFCEQCRKDLHRIATAPNGIRYSTYIPAKEETSPAESPEPIPRDRSRRNADGKKQRNLNLDPPKRRSTMNSREIYDEAEEFRRAIEESKRDALPGEGPKRKRGREDLESKPIVKRQRTGSRSGSPDLERATTSSSDEALAVKATVEHTPKKTIRGAAARNHAAKELREQKERERLKAADSRKSRMERRRGDESDNAEEGQPNLQSAVSSPPAADSSIARAPAKKSGKAGSKTKRTGRNQYTKDRDLASSGLANSLDPQAANIRNTRGRSRSRSVAPDADSPNGGGYSNGTAGEGQNNRLSKIKHLNPNRTSMNEMKKRIAVIMEYVNRAEDEMNRQSNLNSAASSSGSGSGSSVDSASTAVPDEYKSVAVAGSEIDFGALTSKEMINVLKARLVAWEDEYGRYPR